MSEKKPAYQIELGDTPLVYRSLDCAMSDGVAELRGMTDLLTTEGDEIGLTITVVMMSDDEFAALPEGM